MKYTALLFGALYATSAFCSQDQNPIKIELLEFQSAEISQENKSSGNTDTLALGNYKTAKLFFELSGIYSKQPLKDGVACVVPSQEPVFFSLAEYLAPGNDDKKQKVTQLYNVRQLDNILLIHANIGNDPRDLRTKYFIANN